MSGSNDSSNEEGLPSTQVADGADGLAMNCARWGCKRTDGGEVFCCGPDCGRVIHKGCYEYLYIRSKGLNPPQATMLLAPRSNITGSRPYGVRMEQEVVTMTGLQRESYWTGFSLLVTMQNTEEKIMMV